MRRLALATVTAIVLFGALGLAALAQGPLPDCLWVLNSAGAGVVPPATESFVCEISVEKGRHTVALGWTVGATGTATIDVVAADTSPNAGTRFRLRCALVAGISQCQTINNVPYEGSESPFELLGPFAAQRSAIIVLSEAATVTFYAGPYNHTVTCLSGSCVRAVIAEGILGLTIDEGRDLTCLVVTCAPPEPCGESTPTGQPSASPEPSPAGSPTPTGTPDPCPTPNPSPTATATPTATASPSPSPTG